MSYELGNLAALEDDEPPIPRHPTPGGAQQAVRPPTPPGAYVAEPAPVPTSLQTDMTEPDPAMRGQRGGVLGWVFLALLVAAAAGAYFGGVIPR
jgi:hypothetical protein